ncbi:hypothetical protein RRG08_002123, partial [Elysia crispata]
IQDDYLTVRRLHRRFRAALKSIRPTPAANNHQVHRHTGQVVGEGPGDSIPTLGNCSGA